MRKLWKSKMAGICLLVIVSLVVCLAANVVDRQPETEDETAKPVMTIEEKRQELESAEGMYSEDSIVLADTSKEQAELLAERLGADLRTTEDGDYAVLYLPEGVSITDVYADEEYEAFVPEMTPDYYAYLCTEDARGNTLLTARPNYEVSDGLYEQQGYLDYLNLSNTWEQTTGEGVKVAVIDTGIDTDHPEFAGRISQLSYNASEDKVVQDYGMEIIEDEDGHGTAVAGVVAAEMGNDGVVGIAPNVELIVIKCEVDEHGQFVRSSDLVFGLAYAIECDADVVNMSFGTPFDLFSKYTKLAVDSDIICVAAAGNDGSSIPTYPAADENVIGVGALETSDWTLATYSNYGDNSDVLAPGTVFTAALDGGYDVVSGTSLSSPIVTGAVALYLAQNQYAEFSEVTAVIQAASVDLGVLGEDWQYGFGALDIYAMVCAEKGTITYDMLTDEVENLTQVFVRGRPIQTMPEPERENVVLDGWYFDAEASDECDYYTEVFNQDITLYASWINEDEGTAYTYTTLDDGTVEICSYTGRRRYLTVPAQIEGKIVSSIGEFAFANNTRLRSVSLPDGITNIGQYAFYMCTSLRSIEIPEKVERIGGYAFNNCVSLSQVGIVSSGQLQRIGEYAFGFSGIRSFDIPVNLTTLGEAAFYGSTSMRSITVADENTMFQLKNSALYNSAGDTLVYYPAGLTGTYTVTEDTATAGSYAFAYSRSTEIILPETIAVLDQGLFENSYIRTLSIPASVQSVGSSLCSGCGYLGNVTLADGSYTTIPEMAFYSCYNLKAVTIPAQIEEIGKNAFSFSGLKTVEFDENGNLVSIGDSAFYFTSLQSIEIPESALQIGAGAFNCCGSLAEVTFKGTGSCAVIGDAAFMYCGSLKEIILPDSLTTLGMQAFYGTGLETVTIGAGLTSVGKGTFAGCEDLSQILVAEGNPVYADFDGVLYNRECTELLMFPGARSGSYTLPDTTNRIAEYAFAGATKLSQVVLNEGMTEIAGFAFSGCSSLTTPQLPGTLTTIGENAFAYCSSMESELVIPKSVVSLGRFAFYMDYALSSIVIEPESELSRLGYGVLGYCGIEDFTIPGSISTMAQEVFVGCEKLIAVTFEADSGLKNLAAWTFDGADNLRQITFEEGSSLANIEARACEGLDKLERITLENCLNLTKIGNYAFAHCKALSEVTLPDSLEEIGRYAFSGCASMTEITIPANVSFIGRYAFSGTNNLNVYFSTATLPVYLEENWDYGILGYYLGVSGIRTSGDWTYALAGDNKASIIGYAGSDAEITLTTIDGYEIVSIGAGAFRDNTTLQSITLPETLTGIYAEAFKGTENLSAISIPDSVTVIDTGAFMDSGVSAVTFSDNSSLEVLGRYAFANTENLTTFALPKAVEKLRDYVFYQSGLQTISLGEDTSLTEIGRFAFSKSCLTEIALPDSLTKIDYNAFKEAASLETVDFGAPSDLMVCGEAFYQSGLTEAAIPAGVTYLGEFCFTACPNLTEISVAEENTVYCDIDGVLFNESATRLITCPSGKTGSYEIADTVTTLAFAAFEGSNLSEVVLGDNSQLITIGYRAFYDCDSLTEINVPAGVMSIDNYAFAYCDGLTTVTISADSRMNGIYKGAFYNCVNLTEILIPDSAQEIGDYAFYGCSAMSEVQISETGELKMIGEHAFEYAGITSLTMPPQLQEVGAYAFHKAKLRCLIVNEAIQFIGDYAFANCGLSETEELKLPETLSYIGYQALQGASGLTRVIIPFIGNYPEVGEIASFTSVMGKENNNVKSITVLSGERVPTGAFAEMSNLEEVILPDTISQIGSFAFAQTGIIKFTVPSTVTIIESDTFRGSNLEEITIEGMITRIGSYAFVDCTQLKEIVLPESLVEICEGAFEGCSSMKEVVIPKAVAEIGTGVFSDCSNLEAINVEEGNTQYSSQDGILYTADYSRILVVPGAISGVVTIPEGVAIIDDFAFRGCFKMTGISIPSSVTHIGNMAFYECHGLESVVVPDTVETIEGQIFSNCYGLKYARVEAMLTDIRRMFYWCPSLEVVELPESVEKIGSFAGCNSLRTFRIPDAVVTVEADAFRYCYALEELYIGANLSGLSAAEFSSCSSLNNIIVSPDNPNYVVDEGILYSSDYKKLLVAPKKVDGEVVVRDGVEEIAWGAFSYCTELRKIVLPDSVITIGAEAFMNSYCLAEIIVGNDIREISSSALQGTSYVNNPENWYEGVLYLGNCAVTSVESDNTAHMIREGTKTIAQGAFYGENIEYVYLPDSVEYIGQEAFQNCSYLKAVRMSNNLKYLGWNAFWGTKLESIVLSGTIIEMGEHAINSVDIKYLDAMTCDMIASSLISDYANLECIRVPQIPNIYEWFWDGLRDVDIIVTGSDLEENNLSGVVDSRLYVYVDDESFVPEHWYDLNEVYIDDEWNLTTFYANGVIVKMDPLLLGEVVQAPAQAQITEYLLEGQTFVGWDINGDGKADTLPVDLDEDLEAVAVLDTPITEISMSDNAKMEAAQMEVTDTRQLDVSFQPIYNNGNEAVIWTSSDETIATVDENGLVTALAEGEVTITVTLQDDEAVFDSCAITVTPLVLGIRLTETEGSLNVGETLTLTPRIILPEGDTNETLWTSSNENVATVSNDGTITAAAPGTAEITITHGEYTAVYTLTVLQPLTGFEITNVPESVNVGETVTLTVKRLPENTTDESAVSWRSGNSTIASVSSAGVVTAKAPGKVTITARIGSFTETVELNVLAPIQWIKLNTTVGTMRLERTKQLEVIYEPSNTTDDKTVVWSSEDTSIATVNESGLVTAVKAGGTVITGTVGEHQATYTVTVVGLRHAETGIIVTNADDTPMAEETELEVVDVTAEDPDSAASLEETIEAEQGTPVTATVYDITLSEGEETVQPETTVDVEIPVTEDMGHESVTVYRAEEDGSYTDMNAEIVDGYLTFETDHFSVYVVSVAHKFTNYVSNNDATCSEDGTKTAVCNHEGCMEIHTVPDAGSAGHKYNSVLTAPTCTEKGYTTHTCTICSYSYTDNETPAKGHSYDAGVVTTQPTTTSEGVKTFTCQDCGHQYTEEIAKLPMPNPFVDVQKGKFYYNAVLWAVENGITSGTSKTEFSPDDDCTRAQVVTFLWRAAGKPEPTTTEHPFTDVNPKAFYYKAMLWAVENGITAGTSKTTFEPDAKCTRGQVVTFLWRAQNKPAATSDAHNFTDVRSNGFYYKAMLWAVENGITAGTSKTKFSPEDTCTRGQVVTFLYRCFG